MESSKPKKEPGKQSKPVKKALSGKLHFIAAEGKCLPFRYVGPGLARIKSDRACEVDWGSLPYDSKTSIRRALKAGDIKHCEPGSKGQK